MAKKVLSAVLTMKDQNFSSTVKKAAGGLSDFQRKVQHSRNQVSQFKSNAVASFSSVAKSVAGLAAAYVGFQAASSVFTTGINAASSLEGYRNTLEVVMGDTKKAAETMKWAVDFANKTPFETDSVVEATTRLQSYGIAAQKHLPAIGDMAGVMGKDVMQAVEAVADAQTGELERLKEFGITKAMIEKKAGEMFKNQVVVNNKGQIVEQEKFNQALFALMDDKYAGGMERQANTFKGVMSTITGVWKTGLATMMGISAEGEIVQGGLFDTIKDKATQLGSKLTQMANDGTFEGIGLKIKSGIETATNTLKTVKDVLTEVYEGGKTVYSFFSDNWSLISPIVYGVGGAILFYKTATTIATVATKTWQGVTYAMTIAQGLLNGTLAISPLGWIAIAIGAVVAVGVLLWKNWDTIREKASQLWQRLLDNPLLALAAGPFGAIIAVGISIYKNFDTIKEKAGSFFGAIGGWVKSALEKWNSFKDALTNFKMPKWVSTIGSTLSGAASKVKNMLPSFDVGTNRVARDMTANIHKDEMIIPARQAERLRSQGVTIDNIADITRNDSGKTQTITKTQTKVEKSNRGPVTVNVYPGGLTVREVIDELVPTLKTAIENM
ncbi:tape measure protein [Metabacillus litoralis]|uniref:tape measure protein n=1 Tax=Metabacillus litoralis TaxID=152268 RepID=UPI00203AC104|nr:tape measure protein [Metabacillus litoralis]